MKMAIIEEIGDSPRQLSIDFFMNAIFLLTFFHFISRLTSDAIFPLRKRPLYCLTNQPINQLYLRPHFNFFVSLFPIFILLFRPAFVIILPLLITLLPSCQFFQFHLFASYISFSLTPFLISLSLISFSFALHFITTFTE